MNFLLVALVWLVALVSIALSALLFGFLGFIGSVVIWLFIKDMVDNDREAQRVYNSIRRQQALDEQMRHPYDH